MNDPTYILKSIHEKFKGLESSLLEILKEEKEVHDEVLVSKGFLFRRHSINFAYLKPEILDKIKSDLANIAKDEEKVYAIVKSNEEALLEIDNDYHSMTGKRLHIDLILKLLEETLGFVNILINRINTLAKKLESSRFLHKKDIEGDMEFFFASFEHIINNILKFTKVLSIAIKKIILFEHEAYYPNSRIYGRVMNPKEYKKTIKKERLECAKNPTPVFDAPQAIRKKISTLTRDQMKNYFAEIGVVGGVRVVFFKTRLKPINHAHPIPQKNGLYEYKFPKGVSIELISAA